MGAVLRSEVQLAVKGGELSLGRGNAYAGHGTIGEWAWEGKVEIVVVSWRRAEQTGAWLRVLVHLTAR